MLLFAILPIKAQNHRMHSQLWRTLVFVVMMACLPLQGLAALTMPACQMPHQQPDRQQADRQQANQDSAVSHCDHHPTGQHQPDKNACDKCVSCWLILSQALIPDGSAVVESSLGEKFFASADEATDSISPPLFRPPIYA